MARIVSAWSKTRAPSCRFQKAKTRARSPGARGVDSACRRDRQPRLVVRCVEQIFDEAAMRRERVEMIRVWVRHVGH